MITDLSWLMYCVLIGYNELLPNFKLWWKNVSVDPVQLAAPAHIKPAHAAKITESIKTHPHHAQLQCGSTHAGKFQKVSWDTRRHSLFLTLVCKVWLSEVMNTILLKYFQSSQKNIIEIYLHLYSQ